MTIPHRLKLLLMPLLVVGTLSIASCEITEFATAEEKVVIEQLDESIDNAEAAMQAVLSEIDDQRRAMQGAIAQQDLQGVKDATARLEELAQEVERLDALWVEASQEREAYTDEIKDREISPVIQLIGKFLPAPMQPLVFFSPVLLGLAFRRSRSHLVKAARSAARLALIESARYLGRAAGYAHTSEQTARVAASEEIFDRQQEAGLTKP